MGACLRGPERRCPDCGLLGTRDWQRDGPDSGGALVPGACASGARASDGVEAVPARCREVSEPVSGIRAPTTRASTAGARATSPCHREEREMTLKDSLAVLAQTGAATAIRPPAPWKWNAPATPGGNSSRARSCSPRRGSRPAGHRPGRSPWGDVLHAPGGRDLRHRRLELKTAGSRPTGKSAPRSCARRGRLRQRIVQNHVSRPVVFWRDAASRLALVRHPSHRLW